jgi:hypothetical protein
MTTTLEIMTSGMRESNLIGIGEALTALQIAEALPRLQSLVSSVFGKDVGENFVDWPIGKENVSMAWPNGLNAWTQREWSYPRTNSRLLLNSIAAQTIYLPKNPDDGSRIAVVRISQELATHPVILDGNGRLVENAISLALNDNLTAARTLMYEALTGNWIRVTDLTEGGEFPFPVEFDDFFITKLAMRLNPRYGRAVAAESGARLNEMLGQLKARYRQKQDMPADSAVLRTSNPGFIRGNSNRFGWMS